MMKYPPFSDLCQIGFSGEKEQTVKQAAARFLQILRHRVQTEGQGIPMIVLDVTAASVLRVAGKFRYKMILKTVDSAALRALLREPPMPASIPPLPLLPAASKGQG